jgi:hypothetical protein
MVSLAFGPWLLARPVDWLIGRGLNGTQRFTAHDLNWHRLWSATATAANDI